MLHRTGRLRAVVVSLALLSMGLMATSPAAAAPKGPLGNFKNVVVIYEENHSFDNLYGLWGNVNGQHVIGLPDADAAHTTQVAQNGATYTCLKQLDVNLNTDAAGSTLSKLPGCDPETVTFPDNSTTTYTSHFTNAPFNIDAYIPSNATTCPRPNQEFSFGNGIRNGATNTDGSTVGLPGKVSRCSGNCTSMPWRKLPTAGVKRGRRASPV